MMILLPIANLHILRCVISLDSQVCQKSPQILLDLERRSAHLHRYGSVRSGCYGWCQYHNHQENRSIFFTFYIHTNHVFTCRFQDIPRGSTSFGSNWGSSWSITQKKFKHRSDLQKFELRSDLQKVEHRSDLQKATDLIKCSTDGPQVHHTCRCKKNPFFDLKW